MRGLSLEDASSCRCSWNATGVWSESSCVPANRGLSPTPPLRGPALHCPGSVPDCPRLSPTVPQPGREPKCITQAHYSGAVPNGANFANASKTRAQGCVGARLRGPVPCSCPLPPRMFGGGTHYPITPPPPRGAPGVCPRRCRVCPRQPPHPAPPPRVGPRVCP